MKKTTTLINCIMILSCTFVLGALTILIGTGVGYFNQFTDLDFLLPFFAGTSIFFVAMFLEAKYEKTYGIEQYKKDRKLKMVTSAIGWVFSIALMLFCTFAF